MAAGSAIGPKILPSRRPCTQIPVASTRVIRKWSSTSSAPSRNSRQSISRSSADSSLAAFGRSEPADAPRSRATAAISRYNVLVLFRPGSQPLYHCPGGFAQRRRRSPCGPRSRRETHRRWGVSATDRRSRRTNSSHVHGCALASRSAVPRPRSVVDSHSCSDCVGIVRQPRGTERMFGAPAPALARRRESRLTPTAIVGLPMSPAHHAVSLQRWALANKAGLVLQMPSPKQAQSAYGPPWRAGVLPTRPW